MKYTEKELVRIAKREKNTRRKYLVINRLQGKHIPVQPHQAFEMFDALADRLKEAYGDERLLLVGFAETATAIGARLAQQLNSWYIQTTREQSGETRYLLFLESHSHAVEQKLARDDMEAAMALADRVVFVEDEVTTGNTILNIINILENEYPGRVRYAVASLLNGMSKEAEELYCTKHINLHYLVKTDHEGYTQIAEGYAGDGAYMQPDISDCGVLVQYCLHRYLDARRCVGGAAYQKACEALWEQMKEKAKVGIGEDYLVIGTEEFMYPALFVADCLQKCGNTAWCHATTRSPILVGREREYPLHSRYELASLYEDGRKTFIYDLARHDRVWILTDAAKPVAQGVNSLVHALKSCGNDCIELFSWGHASAKESC